MLCRRPLLLVVRSRETGEGDAGADVEPPPLPRDTCEPPVLGLRAVEPELLPRTAVRMSFPIGGHAGASRTLDHVAGDAAEGERAVPQRAVGRLHRCVSQGLRCVHTTEEHRAHLLRRRVCGRRWLAGRQNRRAN